VESAPEEESSSSEQQIRRLIGYVITAIKDHVHERTILDMGTKSILAVVEKARTPGESTLEEQCLLAAADNLAWHLNFEQKEGCREHVDAYNKAKEAFLLSRGMKEKPDEASIG